MGANVGRRRQTIDMTNAIGDHMEQKFAENLEKHINEQGFSIKIPRRSLELSK